MFSELTSHLPTLQKSAIAFVSLIYSHPVLATKERFEGREGDLMLSLSLHSLLSTLFVGTLSEALEALRALGAKGDRCREEAHQLLPHPSVHDLPLFWGGAEHMHKQYEEVLRAESSRAFRLGDVNDTTPDDGCIAG